MKKNRYLALRIVLFIVTLGFILYLVVLGFINSADAYLIGIVRDCLIIITIPIVLSFAEVDKDKIREERFKAYREGYEQGKFDKEMEVTSDVD